ncbi:MAG: Hsp70 family protein [Anaerolineae bacterium]
MAQVVGIDLGTTFSAVATIGPDGRAYVIPNDYGELLTPSVVDLREDPPLVGQEAKRRQEFGDSGIYAFFKRDMGDRNALYLEGGQRFTPVDLSALVLAYLKRCAEHHLERPVREAVITVPAYFNNMQREATIEAGRRAGLKVLRIISEPTAAALAYGMRPSARTSTVLVYDLGGGTFDISLVEIGPEALRVVATAGDHYLGGKDWDDRILQHLSAQFEREHGIELIGEDFNELLVKAEQVKIALSTRQAVRVTVNGQGRTGTYEITRAEFEALTRDLLARTEQIVEQVLDDAGMSWAEMAGVLLVGGSTRMPMVRDYVTRMSGKPPVAGVDPDQAVALGAAIQAAMDYEERRPDAPMLLLAGRKDTTDVISNSLGMIVESADRSRYINSIIIHKNQPIPCTQTRPFQLRVGRSGKGMLEVYMTQGEVEDPAGCAYLGRYVFTDLPRLDSDHAVIDVTYAYDRNGVVQVSAVERSTGHPLTLAVEPLPPDVPGRFLLPPEDVVVPQHLTLYLAFDLSGSMSGRPLNEAKKAAHSFLSQIDLTSASIGLIEFSDRVMVSVPASQNAAQVTKGINRMQIGRTGYSNRAHPFDEIYTLLKDVEGSRYALVLADGVWMHQPLAIQAARRCHEAGIEIIAVGFGQADRTFLEAISSSDQHSFFTNLNELTETFSTIARELTESGGLIDPQSMTQRWRGRLGLQLD